MAKKSRKSRRKAKSKQQRPTRVTQPTVLATTPAPAKASAATKVDLAQEYQYVFDDLRKIAIIASAMFVLLFALAFALR